MWGDGTVLMTAMECEDSDASVCVMIGCEYL